MLRDIERCNKYQEAVERFKNDIKDKIVLDVGCGTGILSCFCAKAGAKKVYAIEASDMAPHTEMIVAKNGLSNIVEVIHGKVEQIQLPVEQVDVIISEWMGIFLLFESMLESVIFARDKWLKPEGVMFPAEAKMYLAPIKYSQYAQDKIEFFSKPINGIDLSSLVPFAKEEFTDRCLKAEAISYDVVVDKEAIFYEMDIKTVQPEDFRKIIYEFEFEPECGYLDGFATWFDVTFKGSDTTKEPLVLSTSPKNIQTHWRQDVFLMSDRIVLPDANKKVQGFIRATQQKKWRRHYEVEFSFEADGDHYKQFLL
jgi:protein arginine N-methyltransferase 2